LAIHRPTHGAVRPPRNYHLTIAADSHGLDPLIMAQQGLCIGLAINRPTHAIVQAARNHHAAIFTDCHGCNRIFMVQ
jgi:hypothetical protein